MKEDLISFETAKLAKEKGLQLGSRKSYCHYHKTYTYDGDPNHPESHRKDDVRLNYDFYTVNNAGTPLDISNKYYTIYEAPTQSLLQKWLREIHNIIVLIDNGDKPYLTFKHTRSNINYKTYEEALESGLYEALKLIKDVG